MRRRKLQIFLSSTYEDLVDHRLAAMEAILAAGHIPAAMEQFSPGDETAWDKIKRWIDESDAFILILGGRYGSINPESGKSYVEMEYEYALEKKKPFFAVVVSDDHHERRLRKIGILVDERENPEKYKAFKAAVTKWHCRFWNSRKDIQNVIFQKLPEWAQREDLVGWVRGDEATNPETANELARLSRENADLRASAGAGEAFSGLHLADLVRLMSAREVSPQELQTASSGDVRWRPQTSRVHNLLEAFKDIFGVLTAGRYVSPNGSILDEMGTYGLVERVANTVFLSADGRRFRNRLLARGEWAES